MRRFFFRLSCLMLILIGMAVCIGVDAFAATASDVAPIAEGYYAGHHYAVYNIGMTWPAAKLFCEKMGGHLATISSSGENKYLSDFIKSNGIHTAYFGYTDEAQEGTWVWVTGEKITYTNWHSGEPNNDMVGENYAEFYWSFDDGTWNDGDFGGYTGSDSTNFICEWDTNKSDQYMILVVDENGDPIEDATVAFESKDSKQTGIDGIAYFDAYTAFSAANPVITVSKDGYLSWTNKNTNWTKSASRFETVILYPASAGTMKLKSALYSNFSDMSLSTNLLTTTKKISLGNDAFLTGDMDFGNFYVTVRANKVGNVSEYQLWQGRKKIATSASGKFSLNSDSFAKGGDCFIRVVGTDGTKTDTHINLTFTEEKVNKVNSISLTGKAISIAVSDDVPFVGGSKLNLSMPITVPVTFAVDEEKISIGFNVNVAGGKSEKEQIKAAKDMISDMKSLNGLDMFRRHDNMMSGGQVRKYNSLIKDTNQWKFFKNGSVSVLGYAEVDHGGTKAKGAIMVVGKIDVASYDFNTWCVVVPVTVQFKFGVEGTLTGEISYDINTSTLDGGVRFTPSATLTAFGGIGVSKLAGVGVYGSAKLLGDFSILPQPMVNKVDLTGELGVKAYLAWLTYEKPFAYNTWHLYTGNTARGMPLNEDLEVIDPNGNVASTEEVLYRQLISGMYDASQYKRADLSYLADETDLMGASAEPERTARATDAQATFTSLIKNTYRNAQPVMVAADDALYAAFLRADASTGNVATVVSRYDGENWDTAVAVSEDDILDGTPSLLYDGTNLWLAYARTDSGYDPDSLLSYAQSQQIVVGRVNKSTLKFTQSKAYSCSGYGHMQSLKLVGGKPTLVYVDSTVTDDNSVLWPEANAIYKATCSGTTWGSATLVKKVNKVVSEITVGEKDGALAIGCVLDEDGYYDTNTDRNVYILTGGTLSLVAEGCDGLEFGALPGTTKDVFLWIEGDTIRTSNGKSVTVPGLTGGYKVVGDSIYYSATTEAGAELSVIKYVNGGWTEPMKLTDGTGYFEDLNVVTMNGEDYALGMYANVKIGEDAITDKKDLVWTKVASVSDIRIDDVEYTVDGIAAGDSVPVKVTVTNAGDHAVTSLRVSLKGGETVTYEDVDMAVGASAEVNVTLTCPEELTQIKIHIREKSWTDYNPDDNTVYVPLGYPDMTVTMAQQQIGQKTTIYAYVGNEGVGMGSGTVTFVGPDGEVLGEKFFSNVQPGDIVVASVDFDWESYAADRLDVGAELTLKQEDLYDYNNTATLHIMYNGHRKDETPDMVLPKALEKISAGAFMGGVFKSVKIPEGVTFIGNKAFAECPNLVQIEIPASVTVIATDAFEGTDGFVIYCPKGSYAETFAQYYKYMYVAE